MTGVIEQFVGWYQQLPMQDKQVLTAFFREQLAAPAQRTGPVVHFGGRETGPAPGARLQRGVCPTCGRPVR